MLHVQAVAGTLAPSYMRLVLLRGSRLLLPLQQQQGRPRKVRTVLGRQRLASATALLLPCMLTCY